MATSNFLLVILDTVVQARVQAGSKSLGAVVKFNQLLVGIGQLSFLHILVPSLHDIPTTIRSSVCLTEAPCNWQ